MLKRLLIFSTLCVLGIYCQETTTNPSEIDTTTIPNVTSTDTNHTSEETTLVTATSPESTPPATTASPPTPSPPTPSPPTPSPPTPSPTIPTETPTVAPKPSVPNNTYEVVGNNNTVCIRLKAGIQFDIKSKNFTYNMNPNTTEVLKEESTCNGSDNIQVMVLKDGKHKLTLVFAKDKTSAFVRNVSLHLPEEPDVSFESSTQYFSASINNSYLCKDESEVKLDNNATVLFYELQVQSYMHNEKEFSHAEECAADNNKMDDIVPIIVACALVVMVVLILIGYLIVRRQSRQRGYQSV